MSYYAEHSITLRQELAGEIPTQLLKELHQRNAARHAAIAAALVAVLAGSGMAIITIQAWYLWLPFAVVAGFCVFNFTVLLHEVVHRAVLPRTSSPAYRFLGLLYAMPSGISASQFTKWHLDHHAELGSDDGDPKRHYLSPKRNARWFKLLYFTPALFPIYFRAAARETALYPVELRRIIARERLATLIFQLSILATIAFFGGWAVAFKLYIVPIVFIFPVAFALNRLGQHYDIDPADPAKWSTLVRSSWFWNAAYLYSNLHLEHHYFPGVPFYNLPKVQRALAPFYARHGVVARSYPELLWNWIVLNRKPHSNWEDADSPAGAVSPNQS